MSNQINDLVDKAAAENKNQSNSGENSNNNNDNNQGDNGAGGAKSQEEIDKEIADAAAETERLAGIQKIKEESRAEFLAEMGVASEEELKEKLKGNSKEPLTPEQEKKAKDLYDSNLRTFAVEKDLMKPEDFDQLQTLKSKEDATLVFDKYLEDWKEENPDMKVGENDITEADILKAAKDDFEKEFKLNHSNEKVKQRGIAKLAAEAASMRSPLESSYNKAKEEFDSETELRSTFPKFVETNQKIANELVPETIEWFKGKDKDGDNEVEVPIEVPLPEEDRKEILEKVAKRLEKPEFYRLFREGKEDEIKTIVSEYADYLITKKTKELGNSKIAEIFLGRGIEKGSTTGATNSFGIKQAKAAASSSDAKSKTEVEGEILKQFGK